jgi:hypothetical protein
MKTVSKILFALVALILSNSATAETAGYLTTQGRASFVSADGYNLILGTEGDDDFIVVQNNVTTLSIDGATGAVTFSGTFTPNLPNNTYLTAKNAAGSANIDVLKVDATDDTVLNADSGDIIKLANAGTTYGSFDVSAGGGRFTLTDATRTGVFTAGSGGVYVGSQTAHNFSLISNNTIRWSLDTSGNFVQDATNGAELVFSKVNGVIRQVTSDGTDNQSVIVAGGGGTANTRGSKVTVTGNEAASGGYIELEAGDTTTGSLYYTLRNASANHIFRFGSNALWTMSSTGTLVGAGTATIGWTPVSAPNQACSTTCVTPCVFGQETTSKAILSCSDATADICLCAGAS